MLKKVTVVVIILLLLGYIYHLQTDKKRLELRVEALAGHNLHLLTTTYKEIMSKLDSDKFDAENIGDIEEYLVKVKAHSIITDSIVGHNVLQSITIRFQDIFTHLNRSIESGRDKTKQIVEIKNMIQELIDIIDQTYYDKSDMEGGKAELNIKNFDQIDAYREKIDRFYEKISKAP
jgi:hypothetical protein